MIYFISDSKYTLHNTGYGHPEQPARITAIQQAVLEANIPLIPLSPSPASLEDLLRCHTAEYIDLVRREVAALKNSDKIAFLSTGDALVSATSWDIALLAVGGALKAVDHVMQFPNAKAFCAIRPPGHHATSNAGMGFCIFNNVAIAARYVQQRYGMRKILIADWDVHHGNGTQDIFYRDPTVFYFSTHEYGSYPGTGMAEETGEGEGRETTLNVPIRVGPHSRTEVVHAFTSTLQKKMQTFQPDFIFISAGFDAHIQDPLGHLNLTDIDFAHLTQAIVQIARQYAKGRIVSLLEGGYRLKALGPAVVSHLKAFSQQ
jgi:acetoin utilization deacetylase AcuC-like enzyme